MEKNKPIKLFEATIHPGEQATLAIPLPEMFTCAPTYMPIKVINGKYAGPRLLLIAAIYGNEINGTEIINRLLDMPQVKNLQGSIIAIPVFNVTGFINRSRYLIDGSELDRNFPGSETGSYAGRLTHLFTNIILPNVDYCIDLQTGVINHTNLPQIYADLSDPKAKMLAQVFQAPVITQIPIEQGSLRETAKEKGIPLLVYEAGEALRFNEYAINSGISGILNVMRKLEMLPDDIEEVTHRSKTFIAQANEWVRAPKSGMAHSSIKLGQYINKGDELAIINDPFSGGSGVKVEAPYEGVVVGMNNLPLVHEGETLFQIAVFREMVKAATHLEAWEEVVTTST